MIPHKHQAAERAGRAGVGGPVREPPSRPGTGHRPDRLGQDPPRWAALLDLANRSRSAHIVTIEDPNRSFLHPHRRSLVKPGARWAPTPRSFSAALKHALRQDPDIIMVGEPARTWRPPRPRSTAAETGHLVPGHPAHAERRADDRPDHRHLPAAPAAADPRAAVHRVAGGSWTPGAVRAGRTAPGRTIITEILSATPGHPEPDPGGQETTRSHRSCSPAAARACSRSTSTWPSGVRQEIITYDQALELCHSTEEFQRLARAGVIDDGR